MRQNLKKISGGVEKTASALILLLVFHGVRNNAMMTYVEAHASDGTGK